MSDATPEDLPSRFDFWIEWKSWALPLRVGALGDCALFEMQVGPFGLTTARRY